MPTIEPGRWLVSKSSYFASCFKSRSASRTVGQSTTLPTNSLIWLRFTETLSMLSKNWETYRKRGRHWEYLGCIWAESDRGAALMTGYIQHIKVIGVRPEDSRDKIRVFRFGFYPELHHGR